MARLRTAIQERRVVRLLYHAFRRGPELRDVEPISLVYLGERWQVAATAACAAVHACSACVDFILKNLGLSRESGERLTAGSRAAPPKHECQAALIIRRLRSRVEARP
jgi:hypothetical protein